MAYKIIQQFGLQKNVEKLSNRKKLIKSLDYKNSKVEGKKNK